MTDNFTKGLNISIQKLKAWYEAKRKLRIMDMIEEAKMRMIQKEAEIKATTQQAIKKAEIEVQTYNKYAIRFGIPLAEVNYEKFNQRMQTQLTLMKAYYQGFMGSLQKYTPNSGTLSLPSLKGANLKTQTPQVNMNINVDASVANKETMKQTLREAVQEFTNQYGGLKFGGAEI